MDDKARNASDVDKYDHDDINELEEEIVRSNKQEKKGCYKMTVTMTHHTAITTTSHIMT